MDGINGAEEWQHTLFQVHRDTPSRWGEKSKNDEATFQANSKRQKESRRTEGARNRTGNLVER